MGLQTVPGYIGQSGYTHPVELDRNIIRSLSGARTGLVRFGDFAVTPTGVTGQVSVAKGASFLLGVENSAQGSYHAWSDAAETQTFAAASGNPRIDSLILRILDNQYGTISGSPRATWEVVQGVAAGSPVARPDSDFNTGGSQYKPGAWFRVADIRRNLGDTTIPGGQIASNLRYSRYTIGDTLIPNGSSFPTDPLTRDEVVRLDTGVRYYYDGSVWIPTPGQLIYGWCRGPAQAAGNKLLNNIAGGAYTTAFTTPSIPIDPNMAYIVNSSLQFESGAAVAAPGHRVIHWLVDVGTGVAKVTNGEQVFPATGVGRVSISNWTYLNGAATSVSYQLNAGNNAGQAYDVKADPTNPAYFTFETSGWKTSQFAV